MQDNLVTLNPCVNYDVDEIEKILRDEMTTLGVLDEIKEGMTIALKLNLVAAMKPETAATTHPSVVHALCRIISGQGATAVLGDSPGGPFTGVYLNNVYNVCGIADVAKKTGARLNDDFSQMDVIVEEAKVARNIAVTSWLYKADYIINVCKLKTHGMMGMSSAVKNMFGSIPGTTKPEYHFRFPTQSGFANMLIDIQTYWKPKMLLHVVDGIVGMEDNGPSSGTPRQIGVIMSSRSPYNLDLIGGRIIGLEQAEVLTMSEAYLRGLSPESADEVDVAFGATVKKGTKDNLKAFMIPDYQLLDTVRDLQFGGDSLSHKLSRWALETFLASKPEVKKDECIGCRKCQDICPANAIRMENNIPVIDRKKCIKCFCCQEFCPKGAMKVKRTPIAKILSH